MINVLVASAAALYGWYAIAYLRPPLIWRVVAAVRQRSSWADHLLGCPWCGGAWISLAATAALHAPDFPDDVAGALSLLVAGFAAACLTGIGGYWLTERWGED